MSESTPLSQPLSAPPSENECPRTFTLAGDDDSRKDIKSPEELPDIEGSVAGSEKPDEEAEEQASEAESPFKTERPTPAKSPSSSKKRSSESGGFEIPFRTVKRAMKLDPDFVDIIQTEASVMATQATELFLSSFAKEAHEIAQSRGRSTIRYEDVAEARAKNPTLAFLAPLLP